MKDYTKWFLSVATASTLAGFVGAAFGGATLAFQLGSLAAGCGIFLYTGIVWAIVQFFSSGGKADDKSIVLNSVLIFRLIVALLLIFGPWFIPLF